jgi:RNA polymerase sigma factor (TIGR02999 family)
MSDVTRLLTDIEEGREDSSGELLTVVYEELRRMAAHRMAGEAPGHTLQPTALVHEAWLQLVATPAQSWQNRAHFFGAAAEAMRRILIASARRKLTQRRGARAGHLDVDEMEIATPEPHDQLLAINDALERFSTLEPRQAELVEATAKRWWAFARAWLFQEIHPARGAP